MAIARLRAFCVVGILRLCLGVVRGSLRLLGYRRTCRWLSRLSPEPTCDELGHRSFRWLRAVGRRDPGSGLAFGSCLELGLLRWWILRWFGVRADLQTGIRRNPDGGYYAHAWLVVGGHVVAEENRSVSEYVPLWRELSTRE